MAKPEAKRWEVSVPELKLWEIALIAISMAILLFSSYLYFTDFPVRKYFVNVDEEGERKLVGKISNVTGSIRRQYVGESDFQPIAQDAPVYDQDTLVTGADGKVDVVLDDQSVITLGPNTMVRLAFENRFSLGGINRSANIDVVAGDVTGESKTEKVVIRTRERVIPLTRKTSIKVENDTLETVTPVPVVAVATPKATPSPAPPAPPPDPDRIELVELLGPKEGTHFALEKGSQVDEKKIALEWKVNPPDARIQLLLRKKDDPKGLVQEILPASDGKGNFEYVLKSPGDYEWEVRNAKGKAITQKSPTHSAFTLDREFEGIEAEEPLVGGEKMSSSQLRGKHIKKFEIMIKWKPHPKASDYIVRLTSTPGAKKALIERKLDKTEYVFNKDKVYAGKMYYRILAPLPSGFVAVSQEKLYQFTFLPPILVVPQDKAVVTRRDLLGADNTVLLTWQKTSFTEGYEIEVAKDAGFTKSVAKNRLKENFFVFKAPGFGKYWWRVKSISQELQSSPSKANELSVAR